MDYQVKIKQIRESCIIKKVPDDAIGFLVSQITKNFHQQDVIYIAKDDTEMAVINEQIKFFGDDILANFEILNFYAWDCLPYDRSSPKAIILGNRIKTLYQIANQKNSSKKIFLITSINAILQKILPSEVIKNHGLFLEVGSKISQTQIVDFLINKGYIRQDCANNVGEFALRGGIVDIVLQQAFDLVGYRIDFFGNEIENIKVFDPITQISIHNVKTIEILPASEVILQTNTIENFRKNYRKIFGSALEDQMYQAISSGRTFQGMEHWLPLFYEQKLQNIFDYFSNPVIFFSDKIIDLAKEREELIAKYYQMRLDEKKLKEAFLYNPLSPQELYITLNNFKEFLKTNTTIEFKQFDYGDSSQRIIDLEIQKIPDFTLAGRANKQDPIELFKDYVLQFNSPNSDSKNFTPKKLGFACLSEGFKERIVKTFFDYNIACNIVENFQDIKIKNSKNNLLLNVFILPTNYGFSLSDFVLIGEQALFGEKITRQKNRKNSALRIIEEGLSINKGELVVHRDHGIGRFEGLQTITSNSIKCEMIKIAYAGNDSLFVSVDDINLISRYGAENPLVQLDKLGGVNWLNRRTKVRKKIKMTAEELLKIASARQLKKSPIFVPDLNFYDEFKNRFGFVETNDQLNAIEDVENDLRKGVPMDRLICGDVGFGKTEVAMRASAIVANFAQVAIITPTTLLCRQHYKNFCQRFSETSIKIAQLSRLTSINENKITREKIASGEVQIVIGTHALIHKNIKFKNLALVIIDEEQHFGVKQKEFLKELRNEVHILALSATPIPRTLQMSLSQVKDLSLIATPPIDRLAVRNFVMPYDSTIAREAIMREYNRSGKIFFVVPRVRDIEEIYPRLKVLLPEIKIAQAHGQMSPSQLDEIMNDFIDGKFDLLLSTTIIESGIDISSANTMIIYKAEMFGLSQLYQLRGRVGRGKLRGYCYFMLDNRKKISDEAKKKLEVMQSLDALGVGFSVANHDMDIRGSGNLLSDEQSGHIRDTGVELYQQMLVQTIENLKNNPDFKDNEIIENFDDSVTIKLGISLLIPDDYINELSLRMSFYKKISNIKNPLDEENLINEMNDRFGKIPKEIFNLLIVAKIKNTCKNLGVNSIEVSNDGVIIGFKNNNFNNPNALLEMVMKSNGKIKITKNHKLHFIIDKIQEEQIKIDKVQEILKKLLNLYEPKK
jgi:transcription-repair coupling factor (superfamily II helicase)